MGFIYQHITVQERMQIGLFAACNRGTYGLVTNLARDLGTSRKFIYGLAHRVSEAVEKALWPRSPGPTPCSQNLVVDRCRLDRAIVTLGLVAHASQRAIADCLNEIYDVEPSLGYINGVPTRASKAAASFNESLPLAIKNAQVEADELFALDKPHLVAVQHESLLILALRQAEHCDASAWRERLNSLPARGVELTRVASDGGKALRSAVVKLPNVEHRLDLWHALRRIGRAKRALEQAAYKAIGKEWELEKKAKRLNPDSIMGGCYRRQYEQARGKADEHINRYDQLCTLGVWAREALEAVDPLSGRIRHRQECLDELRVATGLMRTLKVDVWPAS